MTSTAPCARPAALAFAVQAVRAPVATGAVVPSGRALTRALVAPVHERAGADLRVLEVGAGSGPVTRALARLLTPGSRLDVVEANPAFVPDLEPVLAAAPATTRLHCARIQDVPLDTDYDVVVSALPFSNFSVPEVTGILDRYVRHTGPGGVITWFAYRGGRAARVLAATSAGARRQQQVRAELAARGGSTTTVWANVPPARVTRLRPRG